MKITNLMTSYNRLRNQDAFDGYGSGIITGEELDLLLELYPIYNFEIMVE